MNIDKIPEERLFQNNTREEISRWCKGLKYFHFMRARGGHNCEGDSFCVYFTYTDRNNLTEKLNKIGVTLNYISEEFNSFDPFTSYSLDDLDKLKITVQHYPDVEQPQYVNLFGHKAHIWILENSFEISVSGSKDGQIYKVSDKDFEICRLLESEFDKLEWKSVIDNNIKNYSHCISKEKYPELF